MSAVYEINTPHVISESLGNETVIINLETGTYHNLNSNAAQIWQNLQQPIATETLLKAINVENKDFAQTINQAVLDFLAQLLGQGLIRVSAMEPIVHSCPAIVLNDSVLVCETFTDMQDLLGLDPIHDADPSTGWPHQPKT
jgi:hypothetical protein